MIEVSVIVPVYNASDYLRRCINSILEQTFKNFELILIDGAVRDCIKRLLEERLEWDTYIKKLYYI